MYNYYDACTVYFFPGKSLAAQCALSQHGQSQVGHIMKTQVTSDSLCMERMLQSSLPFILDDPKSIDDIGELLITTYDRGLSGNMRKGLRRPRSIPILCCNFPMNKIQW